MLPAALLLLALRHAQAETPLPPSPLETLRQSLAQLAEITLDCAALADLERAAQDEALRAWLRARTTVQASARRAAAAAVPGPAAVEALLLLGQHEDAAAAALASSCVPSYLHPHQVAFYRHALEDQAEALWQRADGVYALARQQATEAGADAALWAAIPARTGPLVARLAPLEPAVLAGSRCEGRRADGAVVLAEDRWGELVLGLDGAARVLRWQRPMTPTTSELRLGERALLLTRSEAGALRLEEEGGSAVELAWTCRAQPGVSGGVTPSRP